MKYPIQSKECSPISTMDNSAIPINGIKDIFTLSSEDQVKLINRLGIKFLSDSLTVSFKERGKAYLDPEEDRNITDENETEFSFNLIFRTQMNNDKFPLKFIINLNGCSGQPFVNFLGEIKFTNWNNIEITVPLLGRGTVALEGKVNDAHASLCTTGISASFQVRVALLSSILACFELSRDDIEIYRAHLLKICTKYFGTEEILSYSIDKAFNITNESYFDYMKNIYLDKDEDKIPLMLNHFIEFGEPHPVYFYELTMVLTPEEIDYELKEISSHTTGPDQYPISSKVKEIINKFILTDDMYLVKPQAGNFIINTGERRLTIYDMANELNSNSLERLLSILEKIGIMITEDMVVVSFVESGKKYINKCDKIFISEDISDETFQLSLKRKSPSIDALLKIKVFLNIDPIDNVNFFGKIEIRHSILQKYIIPLVGRGTISLEGSINDLDKGFCTNDMCASFLQRVALIYSCLVLLDVDSQDLLIFESNIKSINNQYHGKHKIVDYIFKVAKGEENETYFEYMKKTNMDYSLMPIVLKTILTYNRLPSKYYEELASKYTEEELLQEEQLYDNSKTLNFFPRAFRQIRLLIKNMDIF